MALSNILKENLIKIPLLSTNKDDVITELVQIFVNSKIINKSDNIVKLLFEREEIGSTGLSDGIAIPHAKTELVDNLTIAIGISKEGIDFDALDGNPSTLFFLLLARPEQSSQHMEALSEIAQKVSNKDFTTDILNAKSAKEVLTVFNR